MADSSARHPALFTAAIIWYNMWRKAVDTRKGVWRMAIDPVCKMQVDPETAAAKTEYRGKTYYFCAPGCKVAFEKDPAKYLKEETGGEHRHHGH
jgi:YHS domain-containing protein